ncbi:peptidoglycan editing factor PgeF [Ideonella azotifigens]|uniref:peptidoglycan editing factor PgeF n=3 Tax=Ideonella azotifigens TaxID=513160 RepID=UPI002872BFE0|nr:peptidoglycan editing factor PgeF [Ideonella azotifigens]
MPNELVTDSIWLHASGLPAEAAGLMSTRAGGVSLGPWASLNLRPPGLRGDNLDVPESIWRNQQRFAAALGGAKPVYLDQVHGTRVVHLRAGETPVDAQGRSTEFWQADASITTERGLACTVLVADCLPVLFSAPQGRAVGAAHAGWRGLAGGVLQATLAALCEAAGCKPSEVTTWLGACIGPQRFEVGDEVRIAFGAEPGDPCFRSVATPEGLPPKWWADLPGLARRRLRAAGVQQIGGGQWCTASDAVRFYSYRRDTGVTGRHAAAIWRR